MRIPSLFTFAIVALAGCPGDAPPDSDTTAGDTAGDTTLADGSGDTSDPDTAGDSGPGDSGPGDDGDTGATWAWPYPEVPVELGADPSWKRALTVPGDPFAVVPYTDFGTPDAAWIKWTLLTRDPDELLFQNGNVEPFHADFATAHLPMFSGMSPAEFDAVTLRYSPSGQLAILGAVLVAPAMTGRQEYAVQIVGEDPYDRELVRAVFDRVVAAVDAPEGWRPLYFPAYAQADVARAHRGWFASHGVEVASPERWLDGDGCYAAGWALGRLTHVAASDLGAAYAAGRLRPDDVLLIDAVPAEVPRVAGIIALGSATPSSHVAILAGTFGIPFAFIADEDAQAAALALDGEQVAVRVRSAYGRCDVDVMPLGDDLHPDDRAALLALKAPAPIDFPPKATYGALTVGYDAVDAGFVRYVGGKAAGFRLLRAAIPDHSPEAIALTFDLWDAFMAQPSPAGGGETLAEAIAARLAPFDAWPPPDMGALEAGLAAVRALVREASVPEATRPTIEAALAGFDARRKIRFRSSTNVEDLASFSGAGLYDSYSGCLADDQDDDDVGPSLCDPSKANERGVFRAIERVYASLYNDNAFLARLERGVDEATVGMGVLVHHSFPDEDELANGVGTYRNHNGLQATLVTQAGAVSVTNADSSARPEIVSATAFGTGNPWYLWRSQTSSLVPIGAYVLGFEDDYRAFADLFREVSEALVAERTASGGETALLLNFEYKKMAPRGDLVIKQVRELPRADNATRSPTFLMPTGGPVGRCVFQGEAADIMANHRAKVRLSLATRGSRLDAKTLSESYLVSLDATWVAGAALATASGTPATFPGFVHGQEGESGATQDGWVTGEGAAARTFMIETRLPEEATVAETPLVRWDDQESYLWVTYATPVPTIPQYSGAPTETTTDVVRLGACPGEGPLTPRHTLRERTATAGAVSVTTRYWWPPAPGGIVAGYTAPLDRWEDTTITGLTTAPIALTGYWSQTYRPAHHNFGAEFIFEPRLEEGVSATAIAELEAADIVAIYLGFGFAPGPVIKVIGADGKLRDLRAP